MGSTSWDSLLSFELICREISYCTIQPRNSQFLISSNMWVTLKTVRRFTTNKSTQLLQAWASRSPQVKSMGCFPLLHYWPLPLTCQTSTHERSSLANIFTISLPLQNLQSQCTWKCFPHYYYISCKSKDPNCLSDRRRIGTHKKFLLKPETNLNSPRFTIAISFLPFFRR